VRALAADREALAVTKPAIAGEVHQALDVHRGGPAKITLYGVIGVDRLANLQHFLVRKILHPALDQAIALPCASVMVIMVLLKLAFTWATPAVMFLRSLLRIRCGSRAILNSYNL
jgi:hypothetical protein